jgi:hypothetical protein
MTCNDFLQLSDNKKADCLWDQGKPVAKYRVGNARFVLYQLDAFYVEAEYKTDFLEILMLKTFELNDLPLIYLEQINISGLDLGAADKS